ncbi:glyoxylase-like metal-dependent hydrolase (beta-lactamase superfamily II) [Paracoccus pantotrophus]|uniref:Glyoxylase-like metal-dependent hydrolase (Beta-lactamase superfamily II) n=1 Tax=Paracoccus pantotrophus TaxID=82367 RepID=A0AAE6TUQ7_PARPN|nr:MBL fold metallo-hydrolase [Paracoccus pantotrophus]QFG38251.1 MBL fold metallo-hydrolase [Paracoccus pantotrophus]RKS51238.1 glyoxylase-like metal-dependent hydrolase (beta-lactamase superfamily II) [Paracoccus pantotrophus]
MIRSETHNPPAEGEAHEIAPGVFWFQLPLPFKPDTVNVYALREADGWTLVDSGLDTRRTRGIWQGILQGPLAGAPVRRLIATHHHIDHMGLAGWFQAQGAELWASRSAWLTARMGILDVQERPTPQAIAFWRQAGMPADLLEERSHERPFNSADVCAPLPPGYRRLWDGQQVTFGERRWIVRMGHGHAPEHVTLWSLDDDLVIGGDQLLATISPNLGVYPTEPEADTVGDWLESCERLAGFAQPDQLVLPGHKLPYRGLPTRLRQLATNQRAALDRLLDGLRQQPQSTVGCFPLLYRRQIAKPEFGLALAEAVGHINHLRATGRVWPVGKTETGAVLWGA